MCTPTHDWNHLLCSLSCCHSLINWTHTHTHRLFLATNATSTSQRPCVYWAHEASWSSCRAKSPPHKPDATVNKAKHLNKTWSRRGFHEMWSQHWYDHFLHSLKTEGGRHSEEGLCIWFNTTAAPIIRGGGTLIVNLFSGRLVALTQRLLTRWFTGQDRGGASPPPPDPDCRAQTAGASEHQAGQTHCQWRQREDEERELPGYDSIVQWLWDKTIIIPILSPPSNYPPTLIPTILKCWLLKPARRLVQRQHRQHKQLFRETLTDSVQYTYVCKQNAQGTNAWLWYMCNRVVLLYSYSMNLVFLLVAFNFRKKKKKKKSGCQASVCLFFFF